MKTQLDTKHTFIVDMPFVECFDRLVLVRDQIHAPIAFATAVDPIRQTEATQLEESIHIGAGFTLIPITLRLINLSSEGKTRIQIIRNYRSMTVLFFLMLCAQFPVILGINILRLESLLNPIFIITIISLITAWLFILYSEYHAHHQITRYLFRKQKQETMEHYITLEKPLADVLNIIECQPPYVDIDRSRFVLSSRRIDDLESEFTLQHYRRNRHYWSLGAVIIGLITSNEDTDRAVISGKVLSRSHFLSPMIVALGLICGYTLLGNLLAGVVLGGVVLSLGFIDKIQSESHFFRPHESFRTYFHHMFTSPTLEQS